MRNPFRRLVGFTSTDRVDSALQRSCIGRIVSAITLIVMFICIGLWVGVFLLLQNTGIGQAIPADVIGPVLGITFCGGFIFAIIIGGLIGNALRRIFWRMLLKRF